VRAAAGRLVPGAALDAARRVRLATRDAVARHFAEHRLDAMLAPTLPAGAVAADDPIIRYPDGSTEGAGVGFTRLTMPFNATGQPVLAAPCGFDREGLPIGLQLAGRPGREDRLFELGACYEAAAEWATRVPAVLEGAPLR
jgi:aspartyl-tRNA(Asn)/glutamyl-tRNA(Gln) amidotransferase subunit A